MSDRQLAAVCGIYCGACFIYRAYKDQDKASIHYVTGLGMPKETIRCEGCTSGIVPPQCAKCSFRDCATQKGIVSCSECKDLPCKALIELGEERARKDNLPHLSLCQGNLQTIKRVGIQEWLKQQDKRWSCESCGRKLHWYSETCPSCGTKFHNATEEANSLKKSQRKHVSESHTRVMIDFELLWAVCGLSPKRARESFTPAIDGRF